jgi:hypothetical protein
MKNTITFLSIALLLSCGVGKAPESAKSFADRRFEGHKGVECMTEDTDDDGYVSCTIFLPDDAVAIECATEKWHSDGCGRNSGCRLSMGKGARGQ